MSTATTQPQASSSLSSTIVAPKKCSKNGQQEGTAKRTRLMRIIGRSLLGLMVLIGLAIIICWILVFPQTPVFTVESGHVTAHSLSGRKLNATIAFSIKSYNQNKRAAIQIDSMKMILNDFGQRVSTSIPNFSQPPGNQTVLTPAVLVNFVYPFGRMKELVQIEGVNPELHLSAKIRYVQ